MAGFWGRSRRAREEQEAADAELNTRAAAALVEADERLRLATDEVAFATAELGDRATADITAAIESVRASLAEAFQLHQLNVDHIPDTPTEVRERNARIVQLADWATDLLDEKSRALEGSISRVRQAPAVVESVQAETAAAQRRLPEARTSLERLRARYSPEALRSIDQNPTEAEQLLGFADHSLQVAAQRRDAGNGQASTVALEAATEGVRRASTLLDAIENFEIEALRAESTLSAVVADSRGDLVTAREVPATGQVTAAAQALQAALDSLPAPGTGQDPFADLNRLREANAALDRAVDDARERAARPTVTTEQVNHAIDDGERQLALARDVISGHRGYIGADARTRLAEAERALSEARRLAADAESRHQALTAARRGADLANTALGLAQRDIDTGRSQNYGEYGDYDDDYGSWGDPRDRRGRGARGGRGGGGMDGMFGGLIGGMVLGEILEDFFD